MNLEEKKKFINSILTDFTIELISHSEKMPENWIGAHIREYIEVMAGTYINHSDNKTKTEVRAFIDTAAEAKKVNVHDASNEIINIGLAAGEAADAGDISEVHVKLWKMMDLAKKLRDNR